MTKNLTSRWLKTVFIFIAILFQARAEANESENNKLFYHSLALNYGNKTPIIKYLIIIQSTKDYRLMY